MSFLIYQILCMWWLENLSTPKKLMHHLVHSLPIISRKVEVSFVLQIYIPIGLIMSHSYIVIIDFLKFTLLCSPKLSLQARLLCRCVEQLTFITIINIHFHLVIVVSNWFQASTFSKFVRCSSLLVLIKARSLSCT